MSERTPVETTIYRIAASSKPLKKSNRNAAATIDDVRGSRNNISPNSVTNHSYEHPQGIAMP
ncbi:MAG: hypothetical protein ACE5KU_04175 [Nitrososphaerales archaeon]